MVLNQKRSQLFKLRLLIQTASTIESGMVIVKEEDILFIHTLGWSFATINTMYYKYYTYGMCDKP